MRVYSRPSVKFSLISSQYLVKQHHFLCDDNFHAMRPGPKTRHFGGVFVFRVMNNDIIYIVYDRKNENLLVITH